MDALIFDFDGVVVDSEPVHCATFQQVLRTRGVEMSREDYYCRYLGFDDHDCFLHAGADAGTRFSEDEIARMTAEKTVLVQRAFGESIQPLRGAVELIASAAGRGVPVGVCSGALKGEIELASRTVGALDHFTTIVSAEEVPAGKPDPSGYRMTLERLARLTGRPLRADRSVVVEDAPAGIQAAKGAGMKVLAVANSYSRDELAQADRIVDSLAEVTVDDLERLVS